jgi:hypothetical protein
MIEDPSTVVSAVMTCIGVSAAITSALPPPRSLCGRVVFAVLNVLALNMGHARNKAGT